MKERDLSEDIERLFAPWTTKCPTRVEAFFADMQLWSAPEDVARAHPVREEDWPDRYRTIEGRFWRRVSITLEVHPASTPCRLELPDQSRDQRLISSFNDLSGYGHWLGVTGIAVFDLELTPSELIRVVRDLAAVWEQPIAKRVALPSVVTQTAGKEWILSERDWTWGWWLNGAIIGSSGIFVGRFII